MNYNYRDLTTYDPDLVIVWPLGVECLPCVLPELIKADMNSDILLQTAAIFFLSNIYLKQGIGSVYVIVDFICKG